MSRREPPNIEAEGSWDRSDTNFTGDLHPMRSRQERPLSVSGSKPLLTPDEFRHALGGAIGRRNIYELIRAGRIRHVRLGRKLLIPRSEIEAFVEREANCQEAAA